MLVSRVYEPKPDEIFYHYCSAETFHSICRQKTLRFGDVNMMNDYQEERWGYQVFEAAANEILNDKEIQEKFPEVDKDFFDKVDEVLAPTQLFSHPVISSFSKRPDVLSQWRAYADNGRGFALGFSGAALKAMPVTLLDVQYDQKEQIQEMKQALLAIHLENADDNRSFGSKFRQSCQLLSFWKLGFKNPAFSEENEVRCLHALAVDVKDGRPRLIDEGGEQDGVSIAGQKVEYRVVDGAIIAYVDIPFPKLGDTPAIKEVWLGPRNVNAPGNVIYFMNECGLDGYKLRRSSASYR